MQIDIEIDEEAIAEAVIEEINLSDFTEFEEVESEVEKLQKENQELSEKIDILERSIEEMKNQIRELQVASETNQKKLAWFF